MTITLLHGDCRDVLKTLADESVQMCVTSPPYWGLRDYGIEGVVWGDGWRGCLGLEPTPELFVAHLVEVMREVRRVLRDDGTLWLNLGDSYTSGMFVHGYKRNIIQPQNNWADTRLESRKTTLGATITDRDPGDLKPKDLVGIPWRVAFALQADGWYLRSDIIWHKPNPMPESVTDRPTKAHEYLFLLAKQERYYYDAEAIKESAAGGRERFSGDQYGTKGLDASRNDGGRIDREVVIARNRRSVWTISTAPYKGAHFATFPPALVEPCILAGTSERGCCPKCGKPWERIIEPTGHVNKREPAHAPNNCPTKVDSTGWAPTTRATDAWRSGCDCRCKYGVPCTVLDPFVGSGTVCLVSERLGRDSIGIDLNPEYINGLAEQRVAVIQPALMTE